MTPIPMRRLPPSIPAQFAANPKINLQPDGAPVNTEEWWVVYKDDAADLCFATHERAEHYLTTMIERDKEQEFTWSLSPITVVISDRN